MKSRTSNLGSARASRAGGGAIAIANFSIGQDRRRLSEKRDCGGVPQSAREARALPRICRQIVTGFAIFLSVLVLLSCETANYAPPITPQMATASSRKQDVDLARLERGRTLFVHRCIECHTLPALWKYSREDWPKIVNDMSHRASLKPGEREAVIAYILAVRETER